MAPNPCSGTGGPRGVRFHNLPPSATIRIFTVAGKSVATIHPDDRQGLEAPGQARWDLTSGGADVASGIYVYRVDAPSAPPHAGKLVIVR